MTRQIVRDKYLLAQAMRIFDSSHSAESAPSEDGNNFICFYDHGDNSANIIQSEIELFLDDPTHDISSLQHHPTVKQVFVQKNASLTSSAQVETLFSMGGQILTPRRNKLTDEHFEMLLLFRVNKNPQL